MATTQHHRLSHQARRSRRQQMAEAVKRAPLGPNRHAGVARAFGVSPHTVISACSEFGVKLDRAPPAAPQTFHILAALLRGDRGADVARRFGVSRQRIDQIRKQAADAGIFELVNAGAPRP